MNRTVRFLWILSDVVVEPTTFVVNRFDWFFSYYTTGPRAEKNAPVAGNRTDTAANRRSARCPFRVAVEKQFNADRLSTFALS